MKKYISIMIISAILSVSLCSCAETPKAEKEVVTTSATEASEISEASEVSVYENDLTEEVTEPLTEEMEVVQVTKDYVTAIEKFDLKAIAELYNPNITSTPQIYEKLKKTYDDACNSGISPDDYKAIWEFTEVYDDITFTFNDDATCKIDGNTAKVKTTYTAKCYEYKFGMEYCVVLKFSMIKIDGKWYLNGDPNYADSYATYIGADSEEASTYIDAADWSTETIDSIINDCYNDIKNNNIDKYNVESAELITVADAAKAYEGSEAFERIGSEKYGYTSYWYKEDGYSVFLDSEYVDLLSIDVAYSENEVVALTEDNKPSSSVYVVDLFK